jgi:ABC-type methionine transport system ATPase subunit
MVDRRVKLVYPTTLLEEPVLYRLIHNFDLIVNLRQAQVSRTEGLLVVDLRGTEGVIEDALNWVRQLGIAVEEA